MRKNTSKAQQKKASMKTKPILTEEKDINPKETKESSSAQSAIVKLLSLWQQLKISTKPQQSLWNLLWFLTIPLFYFILVLITAGLSHWFSRPAEVKTEPPSPVIVNDSADQISELNSLLERLEKLGKQISSLPLAKSVPPLDTIPKALAEIRKQMKEMGKQHSESTDQILAQVRDMTASLEQKLALANLGHLQLTQAPNITFLPCDENQIEQSLPRIKRAKGILAELDFNRPFSINDSLIVQLWVCRNEGNMWKADWQLKTFPVIQTPRHLTHPGESDTCINQFSDRATLYSEQFLFTVDLQEVNIKEEEFILSIYVQNKLMSDKAYLIQHTWFDHKGKQPKKQPKCNPPLLGSYPSV